LANTIGLGTDVFVAASLSESGMDTLKPNRVGPDEGTPPNSSRITPTVYLVAAAIAACTLSVHISSYWRSVSLQLCDVTVTDDEGLLSINVPLVRLAAKVSPSSEFVIYDRTPVFWNYAGAAGKTPLRAWMSMLNAVRCTGGMFLDFGYWKGAWQSTSRPGPFIVIIVPIWFGGLVGFGLYLAFYLRLIRFRLRTLLAAMTLAAGLLWLLMLLGEH
jgi:hypothetical protein